MSDQPMDEAITVEELVTDVIHWARTRSHAGDGEPPVWRFERWIREDPERGWEVLRQLVARAPMDAEVMYQTAYRVPQLLHRDFARYRDRVAGLLKQSSYLDALVEPAVFVEAAYGSRYSEPEHLAEIWLRQRLHSGEWNRLEALVRDEPGSLVRFALEVIERGPLHGFDTDDVDGPLLDVLKGYGVAVIEDIEEAARRSVAVRRAIWSVRHQIGKTPADLWARFQAAADGTNTCNSMLPAGEVHPMEPQLEQLLAAWFAWKGSFWAYSEVVDLVQDEPEMGWRALVAIVGKAQSPDALSDCGAGPLEDLIHTHPAQFIDRAEELARRYPAFRAALGAAWITLEDVPEPLARRYFEASGRVMSVLDAPDGWTRDADGDGI